MLLRFHFFWFELIVEGQLSSRITPFVKTLQMTKKKTRQKDEKYVNTIDMQRSYELAESLKMRIDTAFHKSH